MSTDATSTSFTNTTTIKNAADQTADDLRQMGNHQFGQGEYAVAAQLYTAALELIEQEEEETGSSQDNNSQLLLNLCNRSACYYQMELFEEAKQDASTAWQAWPQMSNIKAAYRLAKTCLALEQYQESKDIIFQALQVIGEVEAKAQHQAEEEAAKLRHNVHGDPKEIDAAKEQHAKLNDNTKTQKKAFDDLLANVETKQAQHGQAPPKLSIRDFTLLEELGFGNFSEIHKVRHKKTGKEFALKRINKKKAADLGKKQHPNVFNEIQMERRILCERLTLTKNTLHPFIVQMQAAFDDYEHIYYMMDLHVTCGDLWSRLRYGVDNKGKMVGCHRSQTKFWLYQLVDAIEHMHKHGIVHRDLKPENILLNSKNHIVVIDFGTAKDLIYTNLNGPEFVGTPDFMSPEAVKGGRQENASRISSDAEDYPDADCSADLWALGAIAYILHTGETPFWSPSPFLTFLKIKRCQLTRGWGVADDDAWDFIDQLIKLKPKNRLGAHVYELDKTKRVMKQNDPGGYDCLRNHAYLKDFHELPATTKSQNPVPSLRDLAIRACAELVKKDSMDFDIMEKHAPGDGSSHDLLRLDSRDRRCVMHLCDKLQLFKVAGDAVGQQPRLYGRFFDDLVQCRVFSKYQERLGTYDFCGLTQMNDNHGRTPSSFNEDPYATPIKVDPVKIAVISNPLFSSGEIVFDDETRKKHKKDLKKCISAINRIRPKLVIVNGPLEDSKKLLARISDSIPLVANDGKGTFYTAWYWGVQCITLSGAKRSDQMSCNTTPQMKWLREQLEASRMSKHPCFVFCDGDPRELPEYVQQRLARGRVSALIGHYTKNNNDSSESLTSRIKYDHKVHMEGIENEKDKTKDDNDDDTSIRSTVSDDDDNDDHTMKVYGCAVNAVRWITVEESGEWKQELELMTES